MNKRKVFEFIFGYIHQIIYVQKMFRFLADFLYRCKKSLSLNANTIQKVHTEDMDLSDNAIDNGMLSFFCDITACKITNDMSDSLPLHADLPSF